MTRYLKKDAKVDIKSSEYIESFGSLNRCLTNSPVLTHSDLAKNSSYIPTETIMFLEQFYLKRDTSSASQVEL